MHARRTLNETGGFENPALDVDEGVPMDERSGDKSELS